MRRLSEVRSNVHSSVHGTSSLGTCCVPEFELDEDLRETRHVFCVFHTVGEKGQQTVQSRVQLPGEDLGSLTTHGMCIAWWGVQ